MSTLFLVVCPNFSSLPPSLPPSPLYEILFLFACSLTSDIQAQVSRSESNSPEPKDEKWSDLVDDLWENHLPYFRKRGYVVSSRPGSANSFSNEPDPSSTILNELTRHDSDQNLLELLKKDVPIRHHQVPPSPIPDSGTYALASPTGVEGCGYVICLCVCVQELIRKRETWHCSRHSPRRSKVSECHTP